MASSPAAHRVLEHFLATLDIGVTHITRCDIRDGWSVRFEACETASLHYCLDGRGTLDPGNGHRIALQPHSFVLMPPGVSYRLECAFESPAMSVDRARLGSWSARETAPTVKVGEAAVGVEMACGELRFATRTADPFRMLRHPIVTRFDGPAGLKDQFVMLLAESAQPGLGSRVLIEALLKQCLVMLLRRQMESNDAELSWTAAVADPRLLLALEKLFEQPQAPLSVQRLADLAGMSRSAFASHFERAFGQTPMAMLRAVRLHKAAELLATTSLQISQVAHAVGFSSRSNFSQAFHKQHGVDPSGFRQRTASRQRMGGD